MSVLNRLSRIWRNIFHRERVDDDLNAELNSYLDLAADQYSARGMGRPEALRAAKLDAGGMEPVKEAVRDVRAGSLVESILRDLRFGGRLLARSPGFTAAALLMLAVGIGANTAVFSLLNALVLRGLPYSEPERIVRVFENRPREGTRHSASAPDYLDWRDQSTSFQSLAAMSGTGVTWQSESGAERVPAALVTPEFLDVYGVKPAVGTGFGADVQTRPSAILTHGFWQRRFGGDPAIIGKSLTIENTPIEIAGVLPSGFEYPEDDVELLLPLTWRSREQLDRASHEYTVTGRLKPGISLRAAQAELNTIAGRLESQYTVNKGHGAIAVPLADVLLEPVRRPLLILQFAAALVLLVACGNLANLLLARLLARERELSIRLAIGAGRGHLLRQLLCENLLLALTGGVLGVGVAYAALPLLRSLAPADVPLVGTGRIGVDGAVLAAGLLLSLACALLFGLAPAWRGVGFGWKEGTAGGPQRQRLGGLLIAFQVAFSVLLLTGTTLFLRSLVALRTVDPGFQAQQVLTMRVGLPDRLYKEPRDVVALTEEWSKAIGRFPGVRAVGLTSHLPVSGMDGRRGLAIKGVNPPDPNQPRRAHPRWVSPGYFAAMGLRVVEGRLFLETDRAASQPVMIVNEAAARRYFPSGKAVGHLARLAGSDGPWHEVVGVVADVRHWGLDVEPRPEQYYCHLQQPTWTINMVIQANGDLSSLVAPARNEFRRLAGPTIPISAVRTMDEVIDRSVASERSILMLLGTFGGIALLLTAAGIWGMAAYVLSKRKRELGIRLALGATEGTLIRQVIRRSMAAVGGGAVAGTLLSILAVRATSTKLFGVSTSDPLTYAVVLMVSGAVAWLANYMPARRIVRAMPLDVLRQE
jgi:putative ABC transport system permease protein